MNTKNVAKLAYEPYYKEAFYLFRNRIIIMSILFLLVAFFARPVLPIFAYYPLLEIVFNRVVLLSFVEQHTKKYASETVTMTELCYELYGPGPQGASVIDKLYPQNLNYGKYRIKGITEKGKKVKLRCAVSSSNGQILEDNINQKDGGWKRKITYGKYTKVIVSYDDKDNEAHILTYRLNNKLKRESSTNNFKSNLSLLMVSRVAIRSLMLDEGIILIIALCISIGFSVLLSLKLWLSGIVILAAIIISANFCAHLLLFPVDLFIGSINDSMMLSPNISLGECNIIKGVKIGYMNFYKEGRSLTLHLPVIDDERNEIDKCNISKNMLYDIKYFRLSKILLECKRHATSN